MPSTEKPKGVPDIRSMFGGKNGVKLNGNAKKQPGSSAAGKKSSTLINPGRPNSAPTDLDSGKENFTDNETNRPGSAASQANIIGGVLNRSKRKENDQDASDTFGKKGIKTIFQPIDKLINDKGNIAKSWKVDNSTKRTTKPNIHTISSTTKSKEDIQEFSGTGYKLGSNKGGNSKVGGHENLGPSTNIVRRIPGIGLITSERPLAAYSDAAASESSTKTDTDDNDGAERPYSASLFTSDSETDFGITDTTAKLLLAGGSKPESTDRPDSGPFLTQSSSSRESLSPSILKEKPRERTLDDADNSSSIGSRSNSSAKGSTISDGEFPGAKKPPDKNDFNANGKRIYMPYFSSDDDDSDILFKLGKERDSPPAKRRNIDDQQKTNYPSVCSKKSIKWKKKRTFGKSTGALNKTSSGTTSNRAADRNQRGLSLGNNYDDETTDDEEKQSLGSVIRKTIETGMNTDISPDSDVLVVNRSNSRSSATVSSIASIRILTDSEKSVTVLSSPDGQDNGAKDIVKIESPTPSGTSLPSEAYGIDFDEMSQFSANRRASKYTPSVKRPIPITPPRPSASYSGTPLKRTSQTEIGSLRKKFRFNSTDDPMPGTSGTNPGGTTSQGAISNSQSSSAFHPYSRTDSLGDSDPLVDCPACPGKFRTSEINGHLDECLNMLPDL